MTFFTNIFQPAPRNPDVDKVLARLIDRFFIIFVLTGTLSLGGSLVRVFQFGWMFQQIIHTIVYIALILGFLIRKKCSVSLISLIIFSLAGVDAIANLYTFGLASTGTLMIGYVIIMMATFIGLGTGVIAMFAGIAILTTFGVCISSGVIPMNFDETRYVTSWTAWITQISTFIVLVSSAVVAIDAIKARLLVSLRDLEHKKNDLLRMNHNLINSEKKIRAIIETAPEAITTTDLNGIITSCNPVALSLLGYSKAEDIVGKYCGDLMIPADRQRTVELIRSALEKHIIRDIEFNILTVTGKSLPVKMAVSLLHDEEEHPFGFLTITQDISQAKELEQHHLQAEKLEAIGQLAGGMAHDFNNQLTGIIGFAEMLRINLSDQAENLEDVNGIIHTARRASGLINQLLAFARKGKQQSVSFDLHQIIFEVAHILERTIDKNIEIRLNLVSKEALSRGDPTQIQNAILNLALNARDAMPDGGTLTITTDFVEHLPESCAKPVCGDRVPDSYIVIKVTDTGCGIDESIRKKIFEPFFTTKEPGKGTGMGLASVYGTVKNHNGTITVSSQLGHGTTMTIYLPNEKCLLVSDVSVKTNTLQSKNRPANILLVDDEKMVIKVTNELLKNNGYNVTCCSNGLEAIEYFKEHWKMIDLVILDMVMPGMSGRTVCTEIKQIDPSVHILLYSGHDLRGDAGEIIHDSTIDFIAKPYQLDEFFLKIQQHLERSRLSSQISSV